MGLFFHVADYYTNRIKRRARDTAAKERKRISAALTWLYLNSEENKINSEQEENTSHGTRHWNSLTRNSVKCHNVRCQVITAITSRTKRSASVCLGQRFSNTWPFHEVINKLTNYYYHNTCNGETMQFSLKLNVRHITVFDCDALKLNSLIRILWVPVREY